MVITELDISDKKNACVFVSLINAYIADDMGGGELFSEDRANKLLDGIRAHPGRVILVAEELGETIGMVVGFIGYSTFQACPLLNIHDIIVLPKNRGMGVGRKLMEAAENKAKALGCGKMTLEVRLDNIKARRLYTSMGYGECSPPMSFFIKLIL